MKRTWSILLCLSLWNVMFMLPLVSLVRLLSVLTHQFVWYLNWKQTLLPKIYYNHSKFSKWELQESHRTNLIVFKQWCKQCCYSLDYKLLANAGTYTRTKGQECCIVIWIIQNKRALIEISCFSCSPKTVI